MARVKISEYRAKILLGEVLGVEYKGVAVKLDENLAEINLPEGQLVVKVDQAVKKRNLLGLVKLDRTKDQATQDLKEFASAGYSWALVEPFTAHEKSDEHFLALQLNETGVEVQYSPQGGVDIEQNKDSLVSAIVSFGSQAPTLSGLDGTLLEKLLELFEQSQMTYLEINPLVIQNQTFIPLDAAVEVDSAAEFAVRNWTSDDYRNPKKELHPAEKAVEELAATTPASLVLKVLNPSGSLFLLLSGGGASVVILDEIASLGGKDIIGNYGEYSGNPNEEETYLYTKQVLNLMLKSQSLKKALVIAGGVANFTDVAKTFAGIIRALDENMDKLKQQNISVIVRRGGPNQAKGLKLIKEFLDQNGLKNEVHGAEFSIGETIKQAVSEVQA